MVNPFKNLLRSACGLGLILACAAATPTAAAERMDKTFRDKLNAFSAVLETELPPQNVTAQALIAQAGLDVITGQLPQPVQPLSFPAPDSDVVEADLMDLRLALGLIAQIYGGKDNFDVVYAQSSGSTKVLVVNEGEITLSQLFDLLETYGVQTDGGAGRNVLRVPVILWENATLRLSPGEELLFSRTDGGALVNFGRLEIEGATVRVEGVPSPGAPDFVPFIANAGGASVVARNSLFKGLGFGGEIKFSGFSVVRNPLLVRKDEIIIENNLFDDIVSVAISMADDVVFRNNRVHNSRGASVIVTHSNGARVIGNLISGDAPTNAIRVVQGSSRAMIVGNVVLHGDRAGITVRNDSRAVVVRNNVVWKRGGGGISISKMRCAVVADNLVMDNRQKGIEVRSADHVAVRGNKIIGNKSAGLWVAAQDKGTTTLITGNTLLGNGSGLASASGEVLAIEGNDFSQQFPMLVSGDLATQSRIIASNLDGSAPLLLTAGGVLDGPAPDVSCEG